MSGTDATGIPARDGDGNAIPAPIAPAPVNPVAPPAPLAQDVSDTVILTAIGTLTSALGDMAPAPRTPGTPNAAPRVDFFRTTALEEGDDSQTQLVKILTSLHNVSFSQLLIQESMMRGQILALRAQEGHAKLIVNSIQKLVDSFQRIDPSQTAGTLEEFGNSFGSLADTLKDLFSGQRVESWQSSLRARTFLSTYGPIPRTSASLPAIPLGSFVNSEQGALQKIVVKLMHKRVVFSQPLGFLERTRCLPLLNSWESFQLTCVMPLRRVQSPPKV